MQEHMTKLLLLEIEEKNMKQSRMDMQPLHFSALQFWKIWALAVLLLFCYIHNWYRERQENIMIQHVNEVWRKSDRMLSEPVCHEDLSDIIHMSRFYPKFSIWPLQTRRVKCKMVEELMDELLSICQTVPRVTSCHGCSQPLGQVMA